MDIYPLLGHGYLASYLEAHGYEVGIYDCTFDASLAPCERELLAVRPAALGVYGHILSRRHAFRLARAARALGIPALAGGPDATGYYDDYLAAGFDVVVRGEGEETAREVLAWLRAGAPREALPAIRGLAYREGDRAVLTPARPYLRDLDSLPFPRRDERVVRPYLEAWRQRHGFASLPVMGARGCPFDCAFCYRPVFGREYRMRSPENLVAEIESVAARFGVRHFRFVDDTFVVHRRWVAAVSRLVRERGLDLEFECLSRADLMTDELAQDLAAMGVRRVYFGMESGSERVLRRMRKHLRPEQSLRAAETVRRHGMEFLSWIMVGYPGETLEDIRRTRDMLVAMRPDILSISVAFPIRGTAFYEEVADRLAPTRRLWRRTAENRLVWRGRYSNTFYAFARAWLHAEVRIAKRRARGRRAAPWDRLVSSASRAAMSVLAALSGRSREAGPSEPPSRSSPPKAVAGA
ncbi:MAG: B12-binding domain-containing radical SAM protein [Clostridia bacterium]|nr:B12-binding domain-containing radical SAM protein [Clostridia bacterium]